MEEAVKVAEPSGVYQFETLSQRVIGAALEVHRRLGPGFREDVYENALCLEFEKREIPYQRQIEFPVHYDGVLVGGHTLDLLIDGWLVVELKAVSMLLEVHSTQLQAYLRAADARVGLLLNFGEVPLKIKRFVNKYQG
jgi:GxxExxY protein